MERQMQKRDKEMVPKFLVQVMFALMIYAQWADVPQVGVLEVSPVAESRSVTLVGDRTGKYVVRDEWGDEMASTADDKAGFIGVIGRVIDREREVFGVDKVGPITETKTAEQEERLKHMRSTLLDLGVVLTERRKVDEQVENCVARVREKMNVISTNCSKMVILH